MTATETLVSAASYPSAEASTVDPSADLMWVAIYEATEEPPAYLLMWSKPDSSWVFFVAADSEVGRQQLVQAFITAAGG